MTYFYEHKFSTLKQNLQVRAKVFIATQCGPIVACWVCLYLLCTLVEKYYKRSFLTTKLIGKKMSFGWGETLVLETHYSYKRMLVAAEMT